MKRFLSILKYLSSYWGLVSLNISFNILSVVFSLFSLTMAIPFMGILFDNQPLVETAPELSLSVESIQQNFNFLLSQIIQNQGKESALLIVCLIVVAMTFFKTGFKYLADYFMASLRNFVIKDIRNKIYNKLLSLPLSFYSEMKKGDIISRISVDVQEVEASIVSSLSMLFRDPITIIVYMASLFIISPSLTVFVLILLPISGLIIGRLGTNLKKTSMKGQRRLGALLSIIEETISGLRVIKAFNSETKMYTRFQSTNSFYTRLIIKMNRRKLLASPLSEFLGTIVMIIVMWYGGSLVLNNESSLTSQALIGFIIIFSQIISPAKSFSTAYYDLQKGLASAERIDELLDEEVKIVEKENAKSITEFKNSIEFRNVSFQYEKEPVLKNINIKIEKGKTIAIVGQSGSGKSTIADLIPRFYDVEHGDILIDGVSIKNYKLNDLRSLIGYVSQEAILFNDSFFNNISFGMQNAELNLVKSAAEIANAHDFIESSKNGYYTNVGDRGNKLSGGEKQRISIARAVMKNPPILILDEATSSLDTESERLVQEALINLMKNRTSIVIAHRLSTIHHADEILVVNEGEIVERGTHDQLIIKNGEYKKLHDYQMFV
ncbi:MAG TPA: antibiotic ABC transporter ATP-binding protein [Bacteroidales bacterium]|nr:MAG: antibiotic ABC transporter ATP-binding protein [Bacteroidetes bacterium GWF2_33_38]OFY74802.1 MAG: antibiotic ABC transporter ATP-binding protein [Bacteroidetes bacterium RIFOXYA12_FULL_33_9]OFY89917.1 MAG: antibiotic ABC transporter ATP-binding protein [Bacteroidetes bacterium RIFOXYA2_FULL_33_7]HBF88824.1 antibiotic ABC transporter ATP-binding protein [Bacteroidales bacterium]